MTAAAALVLSVQTGLAEASASSSVGSFRLASAGGVSEFGSNEVEAIISVADAQLEDLLQDLQALPDDLLYGTADTVENYESRLVEALDGIGVDAAGTAILSPRFDLIQCTAQVVLLIAQYGIACGKGD